jgi:peptidyl-prolyl cis-trans isomerase C
MLLQKAQQIATGLRAKSKIEFVDPEIKKAVEDRNALLQSQPGAAGKPAESAPPTGASKDAPKP